MTETERQDRRIVHNMAFQLGTLCGALSRPGVRAGLISLLADEPEGNLALEAMKQTRDRFNLIITSAEMIREGNKS